MDQETGNLKGLFYMENRSKTAVPIKNLRETTTDPEGSSMTRTNNSRTTTEEEDTDLENTNQTTSPRTITLAVGHDRIPSSALTEPQPNHSVSHFLVRQKAEKFTAQLVKDNRDFPSHMLKQRFRVPVRYPYQTEIVRTAPPEKLRATGWLTLADPVTDEVYLIAPNAWRRTSVEFLETRCVSIGFALMVSSKGDSFLWPYLANFDGDLSAEQAIEEATNRWVCVSIDKQSGVYHVAPQMGTFSKPKWPALEHDDVIDIAFADREICSLNHPVMKRIWKEFGA